MDLSLLTDLQFLLLLCLIFATAYLALRVFRKLMPDSSFFSSFYIFKYQSEIEAGQMPDNIRQYVVDTLYRNRFGWFLSIPAVLVALSLVWVVPWVMRTTGVEPDKYAAGPVIVAILSLPVLVFVWFIRAYERDRELTREEAELWSHEFNELLKIAAVGQKKDIALRCAAIRQLQDYLSGAKWKTNQRSNGTAIFTVFSSIVSEHLKNLPASQKAMSGKGVPTLFDKILKLRRSPLLGAISAVLGALYRNWNDNEPCRVRVSHNNLEGMHFGLLDITRINLSGLNLNKCTFTHAHLEQANLSLSRLSRADMSDAMLSVAKLNRTNLVFAVLRRADLRGAELNGTDLSWAFLEEADLSWASLNGANLNGAKLNRTNLSKANLSGAKLNRANLSKANLSEANLNGTELNGANLSEAKLDKANLRGAELNGTNLNGAMLKGTGLYKEMTLKKFVGIKHDLKTVWDSSE